jgi:amidase
LNPIHDPYGAFVTENQIAVRGAASGPLAELSFGVKDAIDIAGARTGFGNPDWLRTHPAATETASAVRRLLAAGAEMAGKTHTDELAYSLTGENVHYGTPRNPHAADRIPGGSSNGSAVAVAGNLVDFALGTDCGGSVRLPASYCGIFGMRPTHGRVPIDGVIPFAPSFDVVGWFARDVAVLGTVGAVMLDPGQTADVPRRLLVAEDAFAMASPEVALALGPTTERLRAQFDISATVSVSADGLQTWRKVFQIIQAAEIWANHGAWITRHHPSFGPGVKERFELASQVSEGQRGDAAKARHGIVAQIEDLIGYDGVLCLPTSPRIAPLRNSPVADIEVTYRNQAAALLCIAGLAGLPQLSLPVAEADGLPVGYSIVGPRGSDLMLIKLAAALEEGVTPLASASSRLPSHWNGEHRPRGSSR